MVLTTGINSSVERNTISNNSYNKKFIPCGKTMQLFVGLQISAR